MPTTTASQARVLTAALTLFTRHGVGGTSLQMIADEIGVTKAAVYYHYKTKEQIVRAVAEAELARVDEALDAAEREAPPDRIREAVVDQMIDLAVGGRHRVGSILHDPVIGRLFAGDEHLGATLRRLDRLLMGGGAGRSSLVGTVMITAAISGTVMHPMTAELSDAKLRAQLQRLVRRFLDIPD